MVNNDVFDSIGLLEPFFIWWDKQETTKVDTGKWQSQKFYLNVLKYKKVNLLKKITRINI